MKGFVVSCVAVLLPLSSAFAAQQPEPRTAEAVIAADNGWMDAEIRGDGEYLSHLLLDGYVSIGASGKITTRKQIVEGATKRGKSAEFAKEVADWKAAHPSKAAVALFGDTAVLTWNSGDSASATPVHSSDIFVYRDGHWRAVYSQHTSSSD